MSHDQRQEQQVFLAFRISRFTETCEPRSFSYTHTFISTSSHAHHFIYDTRIHSLATTHHTGKRHGEQERAKKWTVKLFPIISSTWFSHFRSTQQPLRTILYALWWCLSVRNFLTASQSQFMCKCMSEWVSVDGICVWIGFRLKYRPAYTILTIPQSCVPWWLHVPRVYIGEYRKITLRAFAVYTK